MSDHAGWEEYWRVECGRKFSIYTVCDGARLPGEGWKCGPVGPALPNLHFPGHVDVVAEDETSDSARTSTSTFFLHNISQDIPTVLEPENQNLLQNVVSEETPEHARHSSSGPSRDDSDSQP